ncbi:MAG: PQQ-dependent sugar dehydrogenase, partial [Bacteroidota bacterium]
MSKHFIYPFLMVLLACGMLSNPTPSASGETDKLNVRIDTILSDLRIPWGMVFLPNGDMLFSERDGELRLYSEGKLHPDPIADVPKVVFRGQGGLLDLELHPDYANNGWLYLSYSSPAASGEGGKGSNTALMRARIRNHRLVDQEVLFKASPNYGTAHHFGGRIEFDREGFVYLSVGDRGGRDEVQTLSTMRGKIIRLHDDGRI